MGPGETSPGPCCFMWGESPALPFEAICGAPVSSLLNCNKPRDCFRHNPSFLELSSPGAPAPRLAAVGPYPHLEH